MQKVLAQVDQDGNATIALNRPDVHNALDPEMGEMLIEAFRRIDADPKVRAVVLLGQGPNFCAGVDVRHMRKSASFSKEQNRKSARQLALVYHALYSLGKPTIACVRGAVRGGGVGLVAACDIAIGARDATFRLPEVRLGIVPAVISPYLIAAIGKRYAHRYFLSGEEFDGAEAYRIGLLHDIVEPEELTAAVGRMLADLYCGGPQAIARTKRLIQRVSPLAISENVVEETAREIAEVRGTKEAQEGLASFLEKRAASWVAPASTKQKTARKRS
jgi:methylglutaconyl-CoA hydratase